MEKSCHAGGTPCQPLHCPVGTGYMGTSGARKGLRLFRGLPRVFQWQPASEGEPSSPTQSDQVGASGTWSVSAHPQGTFWQ